VLPKLVDAKRIHCVELMYPEVFSGSTFCCAVRVIRVSGYDLDDRISDIKGGMTR
jgi:hypothetical protein